MSPNSDNPPSQPTVLVTFETSLELRNQLEKGGAHIVVCPELRIETPESYTPLDEAIENLYGYDWLIFIKSHSVTRFLERFGKLGHEISELDSIRVCALGESTAECLEESRVHVDLVPPQLSAEAVVAALANYAGGANALTGLNFLVPQASIGRDYLKDDLADSGARADVVPAYRTIAAADSSLTRLRTLILNGGVDCLVLANEADARNLASIFDVNDLARLLGNVPVICLDNATCEGAAQLGLRNVIRPAEPSFSALSRAIASNLSR